MLSRYDANGDGSINIKTEGSYKHGEFSAEPTHALDLADIDGDGKLTDF